MDISKIFEHFKNIIIGIEPMCVQVGGFLEVTVKQEEEDPATDQDNIAESPGASRESDFKVISLVTSCGSLRRLRLVICHEPELWVV